MLVDFMELGSSCLGGPKITASSYIYRAGPGFQYGKGRRYCRGRGRSHSPKLKTASTKGRPLGYQGYLQTRNQTNIGGQDRWSDWDHVFH